MPGRPPPSSAPLRRVRSRALRAASRARAASIALLMIFLATGGFCSRSAPSRSFTNACTVPAISEFSLPLVCPSNCGCGSFTLITATRPSRTSSPVRFSFTSLNSPSLLPDAVDGPRQRGPEPGQMRAAIHRIDVVREAEDRLRVAVVVLQRDFHIHAVALGLPCNRLVVQHLLAAVQVLDELRNAAGVFEICPLRLARLRIGRALIGQRDLQSLVQKGQLPQPLRQRVVVVFGDGEDRLVRQKVDFGPALLARARLAAACVVGMPFE